MSNEVNATGMSGTNGSLFWSSRLPLSTAVRPGLPSLKMITPIAPAAFALSTYTPKLHPPRWISAILPVMVPGSKSPDRPRGRGGRAVRIRRHDDPARRLYRAAGVTVAGARVPVCDQGEVL